MDGLLAIAASGAAWVDPFQVSVLFFLALVFFLGFLLVSGLSYLSPARVYKALITRFSFQEIYESIISPYWLWASLTAAIVLLDAVVVALPNPRLLDWLEFPIGIFVALDVSILSFKIFDKLFDSYLLEVALEDQSKINTELLALGKYLTKATIVLIVVFFFAQTHQIDLIGLVASVGVAGAAIAFASQKVLEQILWSVVLFIDRPFEVDDYVHLPDRTLGRVESVGWRSTKIRLSGKNTLAIIPNSKLAQDGIENLSRARRVISMVTLSFFELLSGEERASIRDLILESTGDILGIDRDLTQVTFVEVNDNSGRPYTRGQVIFFILGATDASMELRRGLLEIARENIVERLERYGIAFNCEQTRVDVAQPMNI